MAQLRLKLDENVPGDAVARAQARGHDVATVLQQQLGGTSDARLLAACLQEHRVLVSLDLDLADIRRYQPAESSGVIVLRPSLQSITAILAIFETALAYAESHSPSGQLWIVEPGRVRVRE